MARTISDIDHTVTAHIVVRGAVEAIEFYKRALGAEEVLRMPGPDGSLMHAEIRIGNSKVMLAEEHAQRGLKSPLALGGSPVTLTLAVADCDAAFERATKAGAKSVMPPADMFWGDRYGQVADPYGYTWAFAQHLKELTGAEMRAAMKAQFGDGAQCGG